MPYWHPFYKDSKLFSIHRELSNLKMLSTFGPNVDYLKHNIEVAFIQLRRDIQRCCNSWGKNSGLSITRTSAGNKKSFELMRDSSIREFEFVPPATDAMIVKFWNNRIVFNTFRSNDIRITLRLLNHVNIKHSNRLRPHLRL